MNEQSCSFHSAVVWDSLSLYCPGPTVIPVQQLVEINESFCSVHIVVASDWWIGGWKHLTCSTGILSESFVFRYLFNTANI